MQLLFAPKSKRFIGLMLIVLVLANVGAHAAWQPSLSESEIQALKLTVADKSNTQRQANKLAAPGMTLGVEVLLVELQEVKSRDVDSPRLAEVFLFDYAKRAASVVFVEVETYNIVGSRQIDNIHLPLNEREIRAAIHWLNNDATLMAELELEYEKQMATSLLGVEQLDMKVSIWNPGAVQHSSHECHLIRCALVSLFTKNHYNFSIEPVVNLVTGNVNLNAVQ